MEIIFSIGVVILVLTGVVALVITTAKVKRMAAERQKAIELSETLIEKQILTVKNDPSTFWSNTTTLNGQTDSGNIDPDYPNYIYDINYTNCNDLSCNVGFTIYWGESQSLSVERLFSKQGL